MATTPEVQLDRYAFELVHAPRGARRSSLADDVRRGLGRRPRSIPPKYFYDAAGSELFDAICELPEYYLTRAEHRLLDTNASDLVERTRAGELVELGSGMARKTGVLLRAMARHVGAPSYVPFDISEDALAQAAPLLLEEVPGMRIRAVVGDFMQDTRMLARRRHDPGARRLFALLGSTIGNLDEREAPALLRRVAAVMGTGDTFLLGLDLAKDPAVLHAAYNDAAGITARFNANMLLVVNRELGADFDLRDWAHDAHYDVARERIEMHMVAQKSVMVAIETLGMRIPFTKGERILTEISRKFTRASAEATLRAGGMALDRWYSDGAFALALARRAPRYSSAAM